MAHLITTANFLISYLLRLIYATSFVDHAAIQYRRVCLSTAMRPLTRRVSPPGAMACPDLHTFLSTVMPTTTYDRNFLFLL